MTEQHKPKYSIGSHVQDINELSEHGEIIGLSSLREGKKVTFLYQIKSKEVDIPNKRILDGVKTFREDELQIYKVKGHE